MAKKNTTPKPAAKPAAKKGDIQVNFGWHRAGETEPSFSKIVHHNIFEVSSILLLHSKSKGNIPGYAVKYNQDFYHPVPRKKGEIVFTDMSELPVDDVEYFYAVTDIPVKSAEVKKPAEPEKPANP